MSDLGNPYHEVLIDLDGTKSIEFGAIGVPETYLINNKIIVKKYIGPLDQSKLKDIIEIIKNEKNKLIIYILSFTLIFLNNLNADNSQQIDKISKNLRCLICQGQSVYDSQSDFALSMKVLIDNKINEGKTEKEIYDFLKNKYGEWIVYEPEIGLNTILLWVIPLILFIFGGILIVRKVSIK